MSYFMIAVVIVVVVGVILLIRQQKRLHDEQIDLLEKFYDDTFDPPKDKK